MNHDLARLASCCCVPGRAIYRRFEPGCCLSVQGLRLRVRFIPSFSRNAIFAPASNPSTDALEMETWDDVVASSDCRGNYWTAPGVSLEINNIKYHRAAALMKISSGDAWTPGLRTCRLSNYRSINVDYFPPLFVFYAYCQLGAAVLSVDGKCCMSFSLHLWCQSAP